MTVDEALTVLATRPAERSKLDGYREEWDEETCAEVLAEEVERLRELVHAAYREGVCEGGKIFNRSLDACWNTSEAKRLLAQEGEHHDDT